MPSRRIPIPGIWRTMMIKKLTKHGNSMALIIDRSVMSLLNIEEDTLLEVTTDGKKLSVSPVAKDEFGDKFSDALEKINIRHGKALKNLAG